MIEKVVNIKVQEQGIDETTAKINRLEQSMETLAQENEVLKDSMANSGKAVLDNGGAMGLLNMVTGGLAQTVKDAVEASSLFTKSTKAQTAMQKISTTVMGTSTGALKLFRLALIATGVGAIVVALGLLIANFDSVKKAVMNLIPGLSAIGDFFSKIIDTVTDFIGVTSDATRALDKMVEDSEASLKRSEHFLEANGDKYDEYTQRKIKANIEFNKKRIELAKDEELTEAEKFARIKEFRDKADREILKADSDRLEKQQKARQDETDKINTENQKRRDLEKQAEKERQQLLFESAMAGAEAGRAFDKMRLENNKKFLEELAEQEDEALEYSVKQTIEAERKKAEEAQRVADEKKALDEAVNGAIVSGADQTLALVAEIAGKDSKIGKAVAIAQATISGIQGVQSAFTTASASPITTVFPAYPFIQAGLAGAFSAIQIAKIKSVNPSGGGGSSSTSSGGGGGSSAPSFNLVQGTGTNQIAEGLNKQSQPVKAYVVGSDVSSQQSLDRNIVQTAKL